MKEGEAYLVHNFGGSKVKWDGTSFGSGKGPRQMTEFMQNGERGMRVGEPKMQA